MKNLMLFIFVSFFLTSCYDPAIQESTNTVAFKSKIDTVKSKAVINIEGSTTMAPILKSVVSYFQTANDIQVNIIESGSLEGMKSIHDDSADIAMSSHGITDSLSQKFRKGKDEYAEFLLAGDALVFIVNVNNPVKKLTDAQIKSIFKGEIVNWKSVGGNDEVIKILSRDQTSGTYGFLKESILDNEPLHVEAEYFKGQDEILKHVAKEKNSIGYISFSRLDYSIDPLDISFDGGKTFIQPRIETVNNLKYKYFRGLYLYYKPEVYAKIKAFLDTVKSDTVQKIIQSKGYIPLTHRLIANH